MSASAAVFSRLYTESKCKCKRNKTAQHRTPTDGQTVDTCFIAKLHDNTRGAIMATAKYGNASTASTRASALGNFEKFLRDNQLSSAHVRELVLEQNGGAAFCRVMDRYALYLATAKGSRGTILSVGTAKLYHGTVKNWFYDLEPMLQAANERKLKKISASLKKGFDQKPGVMTKQAPPCTKKDLRTIMETLFKSAGSEADYWDAALVATMWHVFGRSSDMVSVAKRSFTVHPGGALAVRLGRMKTSLEQGLSLFADMGMLTCPLNAIAVAAVVDIVPSMRLFRQLPEYGEEDDVADEDEMPLLDYLQDHIDQTATVITGTRRPPGIHAHINRVLKRVSSGADAPPDLTKNLSSHSFRRGGAQFANGSSQLSLQWILDRGGWQLSHLNKAFEYLFNSTTEDQKVARFLSGWKPDEDAWVPRLDMLDGSVQEGVRLFRRNVFHLDTTPDVDEFFFRDDVVDLLCAIVIFNYPDMAKVQPNSIYKRRVIAALSSSGYSENDIWAWSLALRHARVANKAPVAAAITSTPLDTEEKSVKVLLQDQVVVLTQMLERQSQQYAELTQRLATLEGKAQPSGSGAHATTSTVNASASDVVPPQRSTLRARTQPQSAKDLWFHWYVAQPPLWEDRDPAVRQRFHEKKMLVAYMRLFAPTPYRLERDQAGYAAEVLRLGDLAYSGMSDFLRGSGSGAKSVGTMAKSMKELEGQGVLDARRREFITRVRCGEIVDPSPIDLLLPWKHHA